MDYSKSFFFLHFFALINRKAAFDKHALLAIEKLTSHNQNQRDNIESIKKNLQFISWLFIISIVIGVIAIIVELA